ncbi:thioester domain-containing protein [Actinocrispum wychmicini]|uniref:LPXTG-motif cell wall-anchored protein/TQXA domain-containing protein n=1 Tax=Actinocrispum wychmicini TaxID=1213861 RepID=A0A4R2JVF4_9PSEU|nr:thioester domain-containing protein [Actinocrispum wychmicini]TCO64441.1 LPXTG-motif cell wall-anchored protein/TQXA domain-containing protein [Actinocrispum wychmicini]
MNRVSKLRRGAALLSVGAIALMAAAIPASADAAKGVFAGRAESGPGVNVKPHGGGKDEFFETDLFKLKVGDDVLKTYCVDIHTDIIDDAQYDEVPWGEHTAPDSTFKKNAAKINWLLHFGYPSVDPDKLQKAIGGNWTHDLSNREALAGTQASAWHYSDNVDLDLDNPIGTENPNNDTAENVVKVYKYLTDDKNNVGIGDQPAPELTLNPQKLAGKTGSLIGPFTVTTNAPDVVVSAQVPQGVELTDKDGKKLPDAGSAAMKAKAAASDKFDFFVKVPEGTPDGKADITVKGNVSLTLGRLFVSKKGDKTSQAMILAATQKVKLQTAGEASWSAAGTTPPTTEAPTPQAKNELANTGASVLTPIIIGVVLVAGGVGALIFQRRRRRA